jgi:hypothetical protein
VDGALAATGDRGSARSAEDVELTTSSAVRVATQTITGDVRARGRTRPRADGATGR